MANKKGMLFVFLGALFWSLNAPIVRWITMPSLLVAGYRSIIAGIFLLPFIRFRNIKLTWNFIIYMISYIGLCVSIVFAIKLTSPTIAIGMQYASIFWIFLIQSILRKRVDSTKLPGIFLLMIGVLLFMTSAEEGGSVVGNWLAFLESIFFTGMTLTSSKIEGQSALGLTALANLITGVVVLSFAGDQVFTIFSADSSEIIAVMVLGIVQIGLGYGFYNLGLRYTTPQSASVIAIFEMVLGPLWVFLFLKEAPNLQTLIGFGFIFAGIMVYYLVKGKKIDHSDPPLPSRLSTME